MHLSTVTFALINVRLAYDEMYRNNRASKIYIFAVGERRWVASK